MQIWPWWNQAPNAIAEAAEFELGIVKHNDRVLAAELELDLLQMFAGEFADAPTDVARAGERDHRDIRINANRLARLHAPWHHLQDAFRQSSLFEYARYNESAGQRGARIGLQHDRVARRQRGSDGAHRKN